jgi:hypothetical protein
LRVQTSRATDQDEITHVRASDPHAAPAWFEQAAGAGLFNGLRTAANAELLVRVPLVRLDGIHQWASGTSKTGM